MRRSISSGSHLSMSTSVCPRCSEALPKRSTAVWYSGEPMMWTLSSCGWMLKRNRMPESPSAACFGCDAEQLAVDALGVAGGPRGVVHDVADGAILGQRGGLGVARARRRRRNRHGTDGQAALGRDPGLVGGRDRDLGEALVRHEGLGAGVLQDVGDLGGHQVVVDRAPGTSPPAGRPGRPRSSRRSWGAAWPRRRPTPKPWARSACTSWLAWPSSSPAFTSSPSGVTRAR